MSTGYINIPACGSAAWKDPVATVFDLPSNGNQTGDARVVENTDTVYIWSGTAWVMAAAAPPVSGNLTDTGTDGITITGGTGAVLGTGTSIAQHVADSSHNGYLSSTDWSTFNGKQNTLTIGNITDAGTDGITVTGGTGAVIGTGVTLSQQVADATHNGYLSSTDWNTFNNKQSTSLANTKIWIGSAGGVATAQTMSGNVTITAAGVTSIANNAVTNARMATMATMTAKANVTGGTAVPTDVSLTAAATASTMMFRDANINTNANHFTEGWVSNNSALVTLTAASVKKQNTIYGAGPTTFTLPNATTLTVGFTFTIKNLSPYAVTVKNASAVTIATPDVGYSLELTCTSIGSTAGVWELSYSYDIDQTLPVAHGGTGLTAIPLLPTSSTYAAWDGNTNLSAANFIPQGSSITTTGGTTTILATTRQNLFFVGTMSQIVTLPANNTMGVGQYYLIFNRSAGTVTVQTSGGYTIQEMAPNTFIRIACQSIAPLDVTTSVWAWTYSPINQNFVGADSGKFYKIVNRQPTWTFGSLTPIANNYTIRDDDDWINVDATLNSIAISLPDATAYPYKQFTIKRIDSTLGYGVTLLPLLSQTIDGYSPFMLWTTNEEITIRSDGANWGIVGRYIPSKWISFTGSVSTSWGTISNKDFRWRRNGSDLELMIRFQAGVTTNATLAEVYFPFVNWVTISGLTASLHAGTWFREDGGGVTEKGGPILFNPGGNSIMFGDVKSFGAGNTSTTLTAKTPQDIAVNGDIISIKCSIPINAWY